MNNNTANFGVSGERIKEQSRNPMPAIPERYRMVGQHAKKLRTSSALDKGAKGTSKDYKEAFEDKPEKVNKDRTSGSDALRTLSRGGESHVFSNSLDF